MYTGRSRSSQGSTAFSYLGKGCHAAYQQHSTSSLRGLPKSLLATLSRDDGLKNLNGVLNAFEWVQ
jgi:hypothetical protein